MSEHIRNTLEYGLVVHYFSANVEHDRPRDIYHPAWMGSYLPVVGYSMSEAIQLGWKAVQYKMFGAN